MLTPTTTIVIGEWIGLRPNIEHVVIFRRNGEEEINYSDQAIRLLTESGRQDSSRGASMGLKTSIQKSVSPKIREVLSGQHRSNPKSVATDLNLQSATLY